MTKMDIVRKIKSELSQYIDREKAAFFPKFFKALPGGYGEGDRFMGVTVPNQRKVAKKYCRSISREELERLLQDPVHECRSTALFVMVYKYEYSKSEVEKEAIVQGYLDNLPYVNNWDLVDSSAYKILGPHLENKDRALLYTLAASENLWEQRVAVITTLHFIRQNDFHDILLIAELLINHSHDLIHKAVGWMLREVGKRNVLMELEFLNKHYKRMSRTMLRYAIEKLEPGLRKKYLRGEV